MTSHSRSPSTDNLARDSIAKSSSREKDKDRYDPVVRGIAHHFPFRIRSGSDQKRLERIPSRDRDRHGLDGRCILTAIRRDSGVRLRDSSRDAPESKEADDELEHSPSKDNKDTSPLVDVSQDRELAEWLTNATGQAQRLGTQIRDLYKRQAAADAAGDRVRSTASTLL